MKRNWIGLTVAGLALTAGVVILASQMAPAGFAAPVPPDANTQVSVSGDVALASGDAAVDMNNWHETASGSKFKPFRPAPPAPPIRQ